MASRTCGGGNNDDTPCANDAQCSGGGTCQAAYLEQDQFFAVFAQPSFHESPDATLINRDYAAVALENPNVYGTPQIDRYTGLLCDPLATDWKNLPAETKKYCLTSVGPSIKSRHAGAFRIGDLVDPSDALEVNGTISLDTGGDGTLNGSKTAGASLNLNANAATNAPGRCGSGRRECAVLALDAAREDRP